MPRNLTSRQMKFAAAVANPKTQMAAYKDAGYGSGGKPATTERSARRLAQNGAVRASIQELRLQLLPAPEDMKQVYAHGLAVMIQLASHCEDPKVRMSAAEWLCAEAKEQEEKRERLEAGRVSRAAEGPEEIVAQLRALYRKALPEQEPLVEAVSDGAANGEATAENLPQGAGSLVEAEAEAESARAEEEAAEPGETATVEVSLVAEQLNPAVQFRRERIPGYFPARYRRVPIEP